jgi:hypothetical protein
MSLVVAKVAGLVAVAFSLSGIPARPSISALEGTYVVTHNFGREVLVLASNGAYQQTFQKSDAMRRTHSGKGELQGAQVILHDALVFGDDFGKELPSPSREDVALDAAGTRPVQMPHPCDIVGKSASFWLLIQEGASSFRQDTARGLSR